MWAREKRRLWELRGGDDMEDELDEEDDDWEDDEDWDEEEDDEY